MRLLSIARSTLFAAALLLLPEASAQTRRAFVPPTVPPPPSDATAADVDVRSHRVPFGAARHTAEIIVRRAPPGARVRVTEVPTWLSVASPEVSVGADGRAVLELEVRHEAPADTPGAVNFHVLGPDGSIAGTIAWSLTVAAPVALTVAAPSPNPSRGAIEIAYAVPAAGPVEVEVVDLRGRRVELIREAAAEAGGHRLRLDTRQLAAGVYAIRVRAGAEMAVRRVTVVR